MISRYKRNTGRNNANYALKDLYKEYKKQCKIPVAYKVYTAVLREYNDRVMKYIIFSNLSFKMPYRLGYIRGQKTKSRFNSETKDLSLNKLPTDWDKTLKYWDKIYPDKTLEEIRGIPDKKIIKHLNLHTNGWRCRFYWDKVISNVKNQSCYIFKASRTNKERMSGFAKEKKDILYYE